MPDFTGYSSGLCHYWQRRFQIGLLAILLAIKDSYSSSNPAGQGRFCGAVPFRAVGGRRFGTRRTDEFLLNVTNCVTTIKIFQRLDHTNRPHVVLELAGLILGALPPRTFMLAFPKGLRTF